ncbi:hypothetical protein CJF42_23800 [Pseudoalteromonas sp. NBT06-2]|uniref:ankyrin repeat domain-containing protein n=1 Tax=Pseudoalteromonas sp. NBT06-2 TaxID=2025950 RepID=UPI000BA4E6BB|nr:ankyrin repeat domain-containing protein [Pseudoalteromonas sp. NBT06-2]PAJ71966.1 hypothetical protein CJF42_23800 [Pseudoalteromonas sp. NBT06-2]
MLGENMKVIYSLITILLLFGCNEKSIAQSVFNMPIEKIFTREDSLKLAEAVKEKRHDEIKKLLTSEVDINAQGKGGFTVLMVAMLKDDIDTFSLLLESGANPNLLLENGSSVMYQSVIYGDSKFLKKALMFKGNPNIYNSETKKYALHEAVAPQKLEYVKLLVESGADMNVVDGVNSTPLLTAGSLDQYDIAYHLLLNGADYKIGNRWNKTIVDRINESFLDHQAEQYQYLLKSKQLLIRDGVDF